jgi:hypothetical protein
MKAPPDEKNLFSFFFATSLPGGPVFGTEADGRVSLLTFDFYWMGWIGIG